MRTAEEICSEFKARSNASSPIFQRMAKIRDAYNGDIIIPVDDDIGEPAVANLILSGIDQTGARVASIVPDIYAPPTRQGFEAAEKKAQLRKDVWKAWWGANRMPQRMRERARHLIAYGTAPVTMGIDFDQMLPTWRVRNPLSVLPAISTTDEIVPEDMIVVLTHPFAWLAHHYPTAAATFPHDTPPTKPVTVLEYSDPDQISLVLDGAESDAWNDRPPMMLHNVPNRVGEPLGTVPRRPVLDRIQGQYDQTIGMYKAQARLTALTLVATDKAVFPDTYLVSRPGELARFVEGPHDGRSGMVNIVSGGDPQELQSSPGFNSNPMIDRLERGQRITGAIPAEFGGESQQNIRTGRRGDAILSSTIDYPIMEAQEALAEALTVENRIAAKIAKAYWGEKKITVYLSSRGKQIGRTYTPNDTFDTEQNSVTYPATGSDMNALIVGMGQRVGLGIMSKATAAELDPLIEDPERERDRMTAEALDTAVLASLQQAAQAGGLPPQVIARVSELVRRNEKELTEAVDQATKEYAAEQQRLQAQQQGMGMGPPEMLGVSPEEGMLGEASPTVEQAPQGMQNLAGLLTSLRKTTSGTAYRQAQGEPVRR